MEPDWLDDLLERSAAPAEARRGLDRVLHAHPDLRDRLIADAGLARALVAVLAASRPLTLAVETDPLALDVLADLDRRPGLDAGSPESLRRSKLRAEVRIAARDLLDLDPLPVTVAELSGLARGVLEASLALAGGAAEDLAVIGMGKLGGDELNYGSDIDVMFVGVAAGPAQDRAARQVLEVARRCFRVDANLRPQGRDGPLVRTVESYRAYWDRWAEPWEFQALLKARAAAGHDELAAGWERAAAEALWGRTFSADDLRSLRHMKARAEQEVARKGLATREVKRGRGGIRDIEFAIQLLQLVHGRADVPLRSPTTLVVLDELVHAGYVAEDDAAALAEAYVFFRRLEHRLQLVEGQQTHAVPDDPVARERIARLMGLRDEGHESAVERFDAQLADHQATVRAIHERLYFRPLLEAFAEAEPTLLTRAGAAEERAVAFGFADSLRTKAAVRELTRGLTRSSRLMQQMLPLLLSWLADAPDPDLGLLCLRNMVGERQRAEQLARTFRDSPEAARRLCLLAGTSRLVAELLQRNLDVVARLPDATQLVTQPRGVLVEKASTAVLWRADPDDRQRALRRWKDRNLLGITARDLLGETDAAGVGRDLTALAEASLEVALAHLRPGVPFGVVALGRFAGHELSYASDLDVVFVYDGSTAADFAEAERVAVGLRRFVGGASPAQQVWAVDADLRPEGRQGPLARSLEGYAAYFERWALVWERQAMSRARPVAGDPEVTGRFMGLLDDFTWRPGLSDNDVREIRRMKARIERERIPPGEDAQFHLKLGRGSLSDVEWTAQLLQLRHGVRTPSTMAALDALRDAGHLDPADADTLAASYRFCESTRNRLFLVRSAPGNSLPPSGPQLAWLARSLGTSPTELRETYRRVTRRARTVVERVFYGRA